VSARPNISEGFGSDTARIRKAAEAIVFLLAGQLSVGLVVLILFAISFLASPLRPLAWAQLLAFTVLILGGVALLAVVVVKYRREIVGLLRKS
jgi:uncharacterized membrane protein YbhN (UPF0104 family)